MSRFRLQTFLVVITVCVFGMNASPARGQHEGHDMPGMNKPKRQPSKKPAPKKKPKPAKAAAEQVAPSSGSSTPESTPASEETKPETPVTETPSPSASESPAAVEPNPTVPNNQEPPSQAAPVTPDSPAAEKEQPNRDQPADSMEGMDMSGGASQPEAPAHDSMMVMSEEQMNIRVGSSTRNSIAMGQMGSGTAWQPATTPMYMWFKTANKWLVFFHGNLVVGLNSQGGPRGFTKLESQNWFMPMAFRRVGDGTLQLRAMVSIEPFTFPRGGAPLLFQTGESFEGRPLVDAQHPHDLFMELSASYTLPIGEKATWFTYFGYPGEPALGPTAFMHRMSASENPSAPLSHHLQDSTHISFGVLTTGFTYKWIKLEGSIFNGREPDEHRYNFEANPWSTYSFRVSVAPNENWSTQFSYGFLRNPETLEPGNIRRMTASVMYNKRFNRGNWATTLIWGRNRELHGEPQTLNGYTAESTVNFLRRNYAYTRLELVDKNTLLSHDEIHDLGLAGDHPSFKIGAYTFGYVRDIWTTNNLALGIGSDLTFYSKPDVLNPIYGDSPTSYRFFLRIRPNRMSHGAGMKH